jgi:hypothetical protein
LTLVRRQGAAEEAGGKADREAPERRGDESVHAAHDDARQHEDRVAQREVRRDERRLDRQHDRDHRGQHAGDEHRGADHAVRADAQHPRRAEVHRGGAHVKAGVRAIQEQDERSQRAGCDADRDDRDLPDVDAADRPRLVEERERGGDLAERAEPDERDALQQERDRERRHEHDGRRLLSKRPKDEALHEQGERDHDREAEDDPGPDRPAPLGRERERERARHHELAVGEVHEPKHAEHEPDADGHQGVDGTEAERIGERLPVDAENRECHPK